MVSQPACYRISHSCRVTLHSHARSWHRLRRRIYRLWTGRNALQWQTLLPGMWSDQTFSARSLAPPPFANFQSTRSHYRGVPARRSCHRGCLLRFECQVRTQAWAGSWRCHARCCHRRTRSGRILAADYQILSCRIWSCRKTAGAGYGHAPAPPTRAAAPSRCLGCAGNRYLPPAHRSHIKSARRSCPLKLRGKINPAGGAARN